jgi:hypothetical protein
MANFYFFIRIFGAYVNNYFVFVPSFGSGIFLIERRQKKLLQSGTPVKSLPNYTQTPLKIPDIPHLLTLTEKLIFNN